MGLEKQHVTFRFAEETLMQIDEIKNAFGPLVEDRSHALRVIVRILHSILFTPANLKEVLMICQRLQKAISSHEVPVWYTQTRGYAEPLGTREITA